MTPLLRRCWPACAIAAAVFALFVAFRAVPGLWLVAVMLAFTAGLPLALVALGLVLAAAWRRRWRALSQLGMGLLAAIPLVAVPSLGGSLADHTGWLILVAAHGGELRQQAQATAAPFAAVSVDGFGGFASGLAYDPSGQILLPREQRSAEWTAANDRTEISGLDIGARHIVGPYYAWFY